MVSNKTVTAGPLSAIEKQQNAAIEAIKSKFARVDLKLAQFATADLSAVDVELVAEARITIAKRLLASGVL